MITDEGIANMQFKLIELRVDILKCPGPTLVDPQDSHNKLASHHSVSSYAPPPYSKPSETKSVGIYFVYNRSNSFPISFQNTR